jgi:hypothetical protein
MANILKDDVQTYVRALIEKEFESNRVEERGLSQNRSLITKDHENGKDRHARDHSLGDVFKTDVRFG